MSDSVLKGTLFGSLTCNALNQRCIRNSRRIRIIPTIAFQCIGVYFAKSSARCLSKQLHELKMFSSDEHLSGWLGLNLFIKRSPITRTASLTIHASPNRFNAVEQKERSAGTWASNYLFVKHISGFGYKYLNICAFLSLFVDYPIIRII